MVAQKVPKVAIFWLIWGQLFFARLFTQLSAPSHCLVLAILIVQGPFPILEDLKGEILPSLPAPCVFIIFHPFLRLFPSFLKDPAGRLEK